MRGADVSENAEPLIGPGGEPHGADNAASRLAWTNGLLAESYVPLTDVAASVGPRLLEALQRARIAAYLAENTSSRNSAGSGAAAPGPLRLYVASTERADARGIVAAVVRASAGDEAAPDVPATPATPRADPLDGIDMDAAFAEIVADWHVDTHRAIREAERALNQDDEDWRARLEPPPAEETGWLDDEHYVPPPPPPLPKLTVTTALGVVLILIAVVLLGFGGMLGLPFEISLFLGVSAVLTALGLLVMRLRARPDEDDDGAIL